MRWQGGLERAGQGHRRRKGIWSRAAEPQGAGAAGHSRDTDTPRCNERYCRCLRPTTAPSNKYCGSLRQDNATVTAVLQQPLGERIRAPCNGWAPGTRWATLHRSPGIKSYLPLTSRFGKLPATRSESNHRKKGSRSRFIPCPHCKLNATLDKSLEFLICHKPYLQRSPISAGSGGKNSKAEGFA